MRGRGDLKLAISEAFQEGFALLAQQTKTQQAAIASDHDNIIRLLSSTDALGIEVRELRRDQEQRHNDNVKAGKDLEGKFSAGQAALEARVMAGQAALEVRIRSMETSGAKLSGVHAALVFLVPLVITIGGGLVTSWLLKH